MLKKLLEKLREIGPGAMAFYAVLCFLGLLIALSIVEAVSMFVMSESDAPKEVVVTVTGKYLTGRYNDRPTLEISWTDEETGELCGALKDVDSQVFAVTREGDKFQAEVTLHRNDSLMIGPQTCYTIEMGGKLP